MRQERLEQKLILFRCDGTTKTGLGHVSRCLALAEALREDGFACRFLGRFEAGAAYLLRRSSIAFDKYSGETGRKKDSRGTLQAIRDCHAGAVVIDSYLMDDTYLAALDREGAPVLLIDDFGRLERYECSALLNFTVNAAQLKYPRGNQLYLLGPEYLLVRRRLRLLRRKVRPRTGDVRRVLVAMGGVDFLDLSRLVVNLLLEIAPNLSVHVVVGHGYKYASELSSLVAGFHSESYVATQLADLAEEFAWADMCVCGGGLTKYESAYMGVPTAALSQTLEQDQETTQFTSRGLAVNLGLGREQPDTILATRLSDLLSHESLRELLSQTGLACFPEDPTRRAAEAFAEIVIQRK
jgi:UDP-2,4-diacetamido-2,4,6-trideoxy-beta-L-altropyranose hydrolase